MPLVTPYLGYEIDSNPWVRAQEWSLVAERVFCDCQGVSENGLTKAIEIDT